MSSKLKREPISPKNGDIDEGEDLVLDFVEEAGDELEESDRIQSPRSRSLSAPRSPEDVVEETVDVEEDLSGNERKIKCTKQLGPKTPPGSEDDNDKYEQSDGSLSEIKESRDRKRRSSRSSSSDDSSRSRSSLSRRSSNSSDIDRSPPQKYRQTRKRDRGNDNYYLTVEERLRQNKKARLTRLRDARSRHLGYKYVPRMGGKPGFPPQPYFKNPSYYPDTHRDKAKAPNPPPLAQKIDPLPGGRLPLVQRRSSPFDGSSSGRPHSPTYRSAPLKRRRGIVEEVFTVRASRRSSSPPQRRRSSSSRSSRSSPTRSPNNNNNNHRYSSSSTTNYRSPNKNIYSSNLGPQTLYPSRRNPYPPPRQERSYWSGRGNNNYNNNYYNNRGSSRGGYSSSFHHKFSRGDSSRGNHHIFTGSKYVQRPWIPPPPPGKKWNCPRRDEPYVSSEKQKWKCPKRDSSP